MSPPRHSVHYLASASCFGCLSGLADLGTGPNPDQTLAAEPRTRNKSSRPHPAPEVHPAGHAEDPYPVPQEILDFDFANSLPSRRTPRAGACVTCHEGSHDPHFKIPSCSLYRLPRGPGKIRQTKLCSCGAIIRAWNSSANPVRSYTLLNHESPEFVRFVNPGDLRIAHLSCGTASCHPRETLEMKKSLMTTGCML